MILNDFNGKICNNFGFLDKYRPFIFNPKASCFWLSCIFSLDILKLRYIFLHPGNDKDTRTYLKKLEQILSGPVNLTVDIIAVIKRFPVNQLFETYFYSSRGKILWQITQNLEPEEPVWQCRMYKTIAVQN